MARVLIIDSDPVAVKALTGILSRASHTTHAVPTITEAWSLLHSEVFFDIAILESKLRSEHGVELLRRIRQHPFFQKLPVLIYSGITDREVIRKALEIGVQNYLIKPYIDEKVYAEVNRVRDNPWWHGVAEPAEAVAERLKLPAETVEKNLQEARRLLSTIATRAEDVQRNQSILSVANELRALGPLADQVGLKPLREICQNYLDSAGENDWHKVRQQGMNLQVALALLTKKAVPKPVAAPKPVQAPQNPLRPTVSPLISGFRTQAPILQQRRLEQELAARRAAAQPVQPQRPVGAVGWDGIANAIKHLKGYPIIDTVAASFQMAAQNQEMDVDALYHVIHKDPGLTTQLLRFANSAFVAPRAPVEDPKQAIQILGVTRVRQLALSLTVMPETTMLFRAFDWRSLWMHQVGCAMMTEEILRVFDQRLLMAQGYVCGLIHDIGKILLCHVNPGVYQKVADDTLEKKGRIREAEQRMLGCTHNEAGAYFAKESKLPTVLEDIIRWHDSPLEATRNRELVAVVSIANFLCERYEVGFGGGCLKLTDKLGDLQAWSLIKEWLYPGFSFVTFERQVEPRIALLKRELAGLAQAR